MTDKELRKLRRDDLLQILINQQRRIDELTEQVRLGEEALARRDVAIQESGSIAEAALRLSGVFEAAQAAADDYADQVRRRCDGLTAEAEEAKRQADALLKDAKAEAERLLRKARSEADALERGANPPAPRPEPTEVAESEEDKPRKGFLWRNRR